MVIPWIIRARGWSRSSCRVWIFIALHSIDSGLFEHWFFGLDRVRVRDIAWINIVYEPPNVHTGAVGNKTIADTRIPAIC